MLPKKYKITIWATYIAYTIVLVIMMLTIGYDYNALLMNRWVRRAGLIIMLLGWFLWYWGKKKIGPASVDIDPLGEIARMIFHPKTKFERPKPTLVTDGPYRFMRHPQYLGIILFYIGFTIALATIPGLIASILLIIPTHLWRAKEEEIMMMQIFGEKYKKFKQQVKI